MITEKDRQNAYNRIIEDIEDCREGAVTEEGECICNLYPCYKFRIQEALENIKGMLHDDTAEWDSYGCCSNCGYNSQRLDVFDYCPKCGKKMVNV